MSLISICQQLAQCLLERRSLWQGRGRGKREVTDFRVHVLSVFTTPPAPRHRPRRFLPGQGGRGNGLTPRVTQLALLCSVATLRLTSPGPPSAKCIPAKRDDSCVCDSGGRSAAAKGQRASFGAGAPEQRSPGPAS